MNPKNGSGSKAWAGILAAAGGLLLVGRIFPAISRAFSIFLGVGILLIIAIIFLVIYFSCRSDPKQSGNRQNGSSGQNNPYNANPGTNYRQGPGTNYGQGSGYGQGPNYGQNPGTNYRGPGSTRNESPHGAQTSHSRDSGPAAEDRTQKDPRAIPSCDLSPEAMEILTKGRNHLKELRRLLGKIENLNVKKRGEDICREIERILGALQQQPEDIPMVRRFFNYYLPTLGNILLKYLRLEEAGMATEQTTVKVMSCLGEIKTAMEKQYAAIFENDLLDLTVEMEALTQACKRDGLLVSEDFTLKEGEREITLTV